MGDDLDHKTWIRSDEYLIMDVSVLELHDLESCTRRYSLSNMRYKFWMCSGHMSGNGHFWDNKLIFDPLSLNINYIRLHDEHLETKITLISFRMKLLWSLESEVQFCHFVWIVVGYLNFKVNFIRNQFLECEQKFY